MTATTETLWAAEPSSVPGRARIRARIAGLHCSLCMGTIEKALGRRPGVHKVAVSLTHEQALIDYEPMVIGPEEILGTLRDIGYDLYDPRKLRPFEEEKADLVREGKRLLATVAASLTAIALILEVSGIWSLLVPASVVALMVPVSHAILRPAGRARAALGALSIVASAQTDSEHPLATAIVTGARDRGLDLTRATTFSSITGKGVLATFDGSEVLIGSARLLREDSVGAGGLELDVHRLADEGKTPDARRHRRAPRRFRGRRRHDQTRLGRSDHCTARSRPRGRHDHR